MQFKELSIEAWKIQDFNRVWTCDLAIPVRCSNQLSYEATDSGQLSYEAMATDSGFIAQLVRRYRKVTGSNPVEGLNFSGFYTQFLKLRS